MAHILVAEDERLLATLWKSMLEDAGHTVTLAHTGLQTLGHLRDGKFDLLVTDMNMPDGGGFIVTMEAAEKNREMPIIVVTGDPGLLSTGAISKMPSFGADEIVTKPIKPEAFLELIERSLASGPRKNLVQRLSELVTAVRGAREDHRAGSSS